MNGKIRFKVLAPEVALGAISPANAAYRYSVASLVSRENLGVTWMSLLRHRIPLINAHGRIQKK